MDIFKKIDKAIELSQNVQNDILEQLLRDIRNDICGIGETLPLYPTGMYKVGYDLPPGEYIIYPFGENCSIEVYKDSSSKRKSLFHEWSLRGQTYLTLLDGQYVEIQNCKIAPIKINLDSTD